MGGVRLEGLDRLRVTLKVSLEESEVPPVRHNLDLYNDTQLEKMIRKVAERLEVGTSITSGTMSELTQYLEQYRLDKIKEQNNELILQTRPLTEAQRAEAVAHLERPDLLQQTIADLQDSGIIGEEENALILLLAMTTRKSADPISVICLARSGTGKSYLMEMVARCIPDEDKREHTQFTGNSFYYYKREEIRHKVFLIEDLEGALGVLFPIRELQSKKRISKTITRKGRDGRLETVTLVVEGPVSVIACTTKETIYEDNANRSILIYLNDSAAQDARIMQYQKNRRAGLVDTWKEAQLQEKLQQMQKALQPVKVINPYAPIIDLPDSFPKKRRALPILLNFIEAITFYHQYQRQQKADPDSGEVYIESTPEDVQHGYRYLQGVLLRRSDELSGAVRDFYENLRTVTENNGLLKFKVNDIRQHIKLTPRSIQQYVKELAEYGYLQVTGGKQRTGYEYEHAPALSKTQLEQQIEAHTEKVMAQIAGYTFTAKPSKPPRKAATVQAPKPPQEIRNAQEYEIPPVRIETPASSGTGMNEADLKKMKGEEKNDLTNADRQGAGNTLAKLQAACAGAAPQAMNTMQIAALTGYSKRTQNRHLKELHDKGLLERRMDEGQYIYTLIVTPAINPSASPS